MQVHFLLTKTVMLEEVVQSTDDSICTLAAVTCFINQEVDLTRESFTVYTERCALPRCKVDLAAVGLKDNALAVHNRRSSTP